MNEKDFTDYVAGHSDAHLQRMARGLPDHEMPPIEQQGRVDLFPPTGIDPNLKGNLYLRDNNIERELGIDCGYQFPRPPYPEPYVKKSIELRVLVIGILIGSWLVAGLCAGAIAMGWL